MTRGLKIVVLLVVYIFLCGKSCQDDQDITGRQLEEVETIKDNIREEFDIDYLSEESKYTSELAAMQKVSDLADYLEIYADASLDPVFRQKAGDMIRDIFVSENVHLSFGPLRNRKMKYQTLEKFMDKGFGDDVRSAEVSYDSVRIEMPLVRSGPDRYEGTIGALQKMALFTESDTQAFWETRIIVSILASRKSKIFGKDTINTWTVNLGDMKMKK